MWWSRRGFLLAAFAALPACGFRPLYSEGSAAVALQGSFEFEDEGGPFAFAMREQLRTRLGVGAAPRYRLTTVTNVDVEERAIRADRSILRFNLQGRADFAVRSLGSDTVLFQDRATSFTAYSATASPFATRAAEDDARRRLAVALADQIVLRLSATAQDWAA